MEIVELFHPGTYKTWKCCSSSSSSSSDNENKDENDDYSGGKYEGATVGR